MHSILLAFGAGVVVSFSPCVYPLVPVTLGFIGAGSGCSRKRALILSLVYVLGIALTYSLLGVIAALSGKIMGSLVDRAALYFVAGNICLVMGLSMFGAFKINIFGFLSRGAKGVVEHSHRKGGIVQALFLGLFSGLIIGPCMGPVLAGILAVAGTTGNVVYGALLLFVFAWGMGALLVIAGALSGVINKAFKVSPRLQWMERFWAIMLFVAAEYFFIKMGGI